MKAFILITLFIAMNFNTYSQQIESPLLPGHAQQYMTWEPVQGANIDYIVSIERTDRLSGQVIDVEVLEVTSNNFYRFDKTYFTDPDFTYLSKIEAQNSSTGEITHQSDLIEISARCNCPIVTVLECSYTCLGGGWDLEVYSGSTPLYYTFALKSNYNAYRYMTHAQYAGIVASSPGAFPNTTFIYGVVQSDGYCDVNGYPVMGTIAKIPIKNRYGFRQTQSATNPCSLGTAGILPSFNSAYAANVGFPFTENGISYSSIACDPFTSCNTGNGGSGNTSGSGGPTYDWIDSLFILDFDIIFDSLVGFGSPTTTDGTGLYELEEAFNFNAASQILHVFENDIMDDFQKNDFIQSVELIQISDFTSEQYSEFVSANDLMAGFPTGMRFDIDMSTKPVGLYELRINPLEGPSVQYLFENKQGASAITLLSLEEVKENYKISIYPTPFEENFNLQISELAENDNYTVQVYNVIGDIVLDIHNLSDSNLKIDLSNEKKGVYILKVSFESNSQTFRLVKH